MITEIDFPRPNIKLAEIIETRTQTRGHRVEVRAGTQQRLTVRDVFEFAERLRKSAIPLDTKIRHVLHVDSSDVVALFADNVESETKVVP